ncbi:hypothetical protein [Wenyingzhuangia sp. 2_MG-2023]|uniref:hypothetical protein n=1 Tax=Wenyingzhuangia sp. 2_MG-2023 TaxID=3062639 RepID=UPI0026E33DF1|nr:hypothetical protein [Wenyingzhuangia sp. 2_MG-2023]MDO6738659.1 hypothetical protein [Wenyingzhuangia sp. 2_MG-2023]
MTIFYIILALVGFFVLFGVIGTIQEKNNPKLKESKSTKKPQSRTNKTLPTVQQLVDEVKTIEDFKKLRTAFYRAEKSYKNSQTDNPQIEKKYRIYDDAFWKTSDKTLYRQFVPHLDLNMSKDKIENAYKIIPISEYETIRNEIGGTEYEWTEISANDFIEKEFEKKPMYFDSLSKFQNITNNDEKTYEEKIELINEFAKSNKPFVDEFFHGLKPNELGIEWIKERLQEFGIPMVDKVYELGYTTPKKVLEIDIVEMKNISGFGPKKIEQLKQAIERIKTA